MSTDALGQIVRRFLERPFHSDIECLNRALCRAGAPTAGFEIAPPSVLTGDPFSLVPGECIGVFGLNPMWHAGARAEADRTTAELEGGRIRDYERRRARYFDDDGPEYNWRYFSRLGNRIRNAGLGVTAGSPRAVFRDHAFKLDLLPWWSVDVDRIQASNLRSQVEPIGAWKEVVHAFVQELRPRLLLVNGSGWNRFAADLLEAPLDEFRYAGGRRAWCGMAFGTIPVLVHGQVGQRWGPQSDALYGEMIRHWRLLQPVI